LAKFLLSIALPDVFCKLKEKNPPIPKDRRAKKGLKPRLEFETESKLELTGAGGGRYLSEGSARNVC
jgi:hypothetical protein